MSLKWNSVLLIKYLLHIFKCTEFSRKATVVEIKERLDLEVGGTFPRVVHLSKRSDP